MQTESASARRDSFASSLRSLEDDLAYLASDHASALTDEPSYAPAATRSQTGATDDADGHSFPPPTARTVSSATDPVSPAKAPNNRSRARAFSFLSVNHGQTGYGQSGLSPLGTPADEVGGLSPALSVASHVPFVGGAYESAFDDDEDDEETEEAAGLTSDDEESDPSRSQRRRGSDSLALNRLDSHTSSSGVAPRRTLYRVRFQPLDALELAWMGASALAVLALTVGALVVAFLG
ncbi:hypothetical protein JCM8202_005728 [Rhodotorula sphaerocarpa]